LELTQVQLRRKSIISYSIWENTENKTYKTDRVNRNQTIKNSGQFSKSAKKKLTKILDIWAWTLEKTNTKFSFITLTLSSKFNQETDYTYYLKLFIEKIKYRYGNINLAWKLELQKNGNPHYHLIIDKEIDWRIIRGIWNNIQKKEVKGYQIKMRNKYKNGFEYDENLKENGKIVNEEIQLKRYEKGVKANWLNPNSTDVEIINNEDEAVFKYIAKYVSKEEEEVKNSYKTNRYWGCTDNLKKLDYQKIYINELDEITINQLQKNLIKTINTEQGKEICTIYNQVNTTQINNLINEKQKENIKLINQDTIKPNYKTIEKDIIKYNKLINK